jgi:hypothetical protein
MMYVGIQPEHPASMRGDCEPWLGHVSRYSRYHVQHHSPSPSRAVSTSLRKASAQHRHSLLIQTRHGEYI